MQTYCLFLFCDRRGPHKHETCETCGAVRHGNINCIACVRWIQRLRPSEFQRVIIKILKRREDGRL